jgi:hypothetical protein
MEQKKSEFNKVLNAWDVLVIAFGAMIGWGWVVSTGGWIEKGGVLGAAIGFVIGGIMIFFVGMTYAELTAAMPQCGGEHVFSYKAMGSTGSFICTWMIILGYVSVACFEACAFPTIITYLWPGFLKGYLYTVAGFDIYASWLIVAIVVAFLIMMINIIGAKTAAVLQTVLTCIIGGAGILLIIASVINGTVDNLNGQMFVSSSAGLNVKAIIGVAALSPFYLIGFDVIPQAAEEINVPAKKIGSILICSSGSCVLCTCHCCGRPRYESTGNCCFRAGNRTCHSRCNGCRLQHEDNGKGYNSRWNVRYRNLMELIFARRLTCYVLNGRVIHDSKVFCKASSKAQDTNQLTDSHRIPHNACSFCRQKDARMDL